MHLSALIIRYMVKILQNDGNKIVRNKGKKKVKRRDKISSESKEDLFDVSTR